MAADGVRDALRGSSVGDSDRFLRRSRSKIAAVPECLILDSSVISFAIFCSSAGLLALAPSTASDSDFFANTFSRTENRTSTHTLRQCNFHSLCWL